MSIKPLWDLPTRVCHWLFAVVVGVSWWTAEFEHLQWHTWSGYTLLVLILFRIAWGFVGSRTSRFAHFLHGPRVVFNYARTLLKRDGPPSVGHNPMGAWSVVLLLLLMLIQVLLGLFSEDIDGLVSGPFSHLVSYDTARWAAETHEALFDVLLLFLGLHVGVVVYYMLYKKDNLLSPMITGYKNGVDTTTVKIVPLRWAIVLFTAVTCLVWLLVA